MIINTGILAVSLVLFVYWFRYTCLLILRAKTSRDYSLEVAAANGLRFADIERQAAGAGDRRTLDRLQRELHRDYRVVSALLRHSAVSDYPGSALEEWMLKADYHILAGWVLFSRNLFRAASGDQVAEMCQIIGYFANASGQRTLCRSAQ